MDGFIHSVTRDIGVKYPSKSAPSTSFLFISSFIFRKKPMRKLQSILLIMLWPALLMGQTSWKGTTSTDWSNAKNWTNGVPTSAVDAVLGDANFTGINNPRLSTQSTCKSLTVGGTKATTFTVGDRNLTVTGSVSIASNGTISHGRGTFTVQGNWANDGSYTATKNQSTISFSGIGAQTIGGTSTTTFRKFTIGKTSIVNCTQNIVDNGAGASIIVNGTFDPGNFQITGGASMTVNSGGVLVVIKSTFAGNFGTSGGKSLNLASTVNYTSNGVQTIDQTLSYGNLVLSTGGTKSAGGNLTIRSNLTINSGVILNGGTRTFTVSGNILNNGTFNPNTSTVVVTGSANTSIAGQTTFNILTVNKSSSANSVTLGSSLTIGTLNMTLGSMLTGNDSVTITSARSGSGIIFGTIVRQHTFANATAYTFEGLNNTITFTSPAGITSVTVTVAQTPSPDFPSGVSVNRHYAMRIPNGSYTSATVRLHYLDAELNANTESSLVLWHQDTAWSQSGKTANDSVNNWVEQNGIADISGNWTLGALVGPKIVRWNGSSSTAWEDSSNWTVISGTPGKPPTAVDLVELGTDLFLNDPTISSSASIRGVSFGSAQAVTLTIGSGGSLQTAGNVSGIWDGSASHAIQLGGQSATIGANLILGDGIPGQTIDLTIGSGSATLQQSLVQTGGASVTFTAAGQLNIGGDYEYAGGSLTAGSGTITYNGTGSQKIASGVVYNNLVINKLSGSATTDSSVTAIGNLSINSGSLGTSAPVTVGGNITIATGATLDASTSTVSLGGNWSRSGSFVSGEGEVIFNGSGSQSIGATSFTNLTIFKPAGTATLAGNLTVNGNLNLSGGTLNLATYTANDNVGSNAFDMLAGTTLQVGGAGNFPSNYAATSIAPTNTTEYNASVAQSIDSTVAFGNLTLTNSSIKLLTGGTSVIGNLLINPGATLSAGSYVLDVQGNWTNQGTFIPSTGAVVLDGMTAQVIGGSDTTSFYDLIINNTSGVVIASSPIVSDTLTLSGGNIFTTNRAVCLGPSAGISRTNGSIVGKLQKSFTTGVKAFTFPVGDTANYTPVFVSNLNVTGAGTLTASVTKKESPSIASSTIDFNKDVNRYWTMTTGAGLVVPTYDAQFTFVSSDVDVGATLANFVVQRFTGARWDSTTRGTVTDTSVQVLQDTLFGDYAIGEKRPDSLLAFSVRAGWNLLSLPVEVADPRVTSIFPVGRSTLAYRWAGVYQVRDSVFARSGYWIKFTGPQPVEAKGIPVTAETLQIVTGWNMIGSLIGPVATSSIVSQPPSIMTSPFYRYDGVYKIVDTLQPWYGYWIKAKQSGQFIISSGPLNVPGAGRINVVSDNELPPTPPESGSSNLDPPAADQIPNRFVLEQNYPNPFNPTTRLSFVISARGGSTSGGSFVTLKVYDVLGREIKTLVDGIQSAGYKSVTWDARDVPSGVYYYKLEATSTVDPANVFTSVRKMLLVK